MTRSHALQPSAMRQPNHLSTYAPWGITAGVFGVVSAAFGDQAGRAENRRRDARAVLAFARDINLVSHDGTMTTTSSLSPERKAAAERIIAESTRTHRIGVRIAAVSGIIAAEAAYVGLFPTFNRSHRPGLASAEMALGGDLAVGGVALAALARHAYRPASVADQIDHNAGAIAEHVASVHRVLALGAGATALAAGAVGAYEMATHSTSMARKVSPPH
jgi:hypothetical protein